jgi:opacity protein-like surface antigen
MLRKNLRAAAFIFFTISGSFAQESRSAFSLQAMGVFTKATSGTLTSYSATETGGFLATYRHRLHRRLSAELAYGFDRNTQKFQYTTTGFPIQSNNHQLTAALVQALPSFGGGRRLSPYVLAGAGALIFNPSGTQFNTQSGAQTQTKPAFVYGAA